MPVGGDRGEARHGGHQKRTGHGAAGQRGDRGAPGIRGPTGVAIAPQEAQTARTGLVVKTTRPQSAMRDNA